MTEYPESNMQLSKNKKIPQQWETSRPAEVKDGGPTQRSLRGRADEYESSCTTTMLCGHVFIYISMQKASNLAFAYVPIMNSLNEAAAFSVHDG